MAAPLTVPDWIARKRDGLALDGETIERFIEGVASDRIPDYQVTAMLMAVVWRGLDRRELVTWTRAMIRSGEVLSFRGLPGPTVDKHSTGGVGDKVTLCLAPLVAACGVFAPLLSGRALGHTGGTLDKLAAIPGFRHQLTPAEIRRVLRRAGFVIAGQTARIVPADRRLYALRDATATVQSIPLIASSILSKKIAGGAGALVLDVKVGAGAFLPEPRRTRALARTLVALGGRLGLRTSAILSAMDQPLGRAVGNASELAEAVEILRGGGPPDTRALTLELGAEMLTIGGVAPSRGEARRRLEAAIASGAAMERLLRGVHLQGGDPRVLERPERLPRARHHVVVRAPRAGFVTRIDALQIGRAATLLGAGRLSAEEHIDPGVGILLDAKEGEAVQARDALATLWYQDPARLRAALPVVRAAFRIGGRRPAPRPLILGRIPPPPISAD